MKLNGDIPDASLQLDADGFPRGITATTDAIEELPVHSLRAKFSGTAQSLRDILALLNGALELHGGPGVVDDVGRNMAMGLFTDTKRIQL